MADTKISDDSAASALTGAELLAGVQSGANVKITPTQLATYVATVLGRHGFRYTIELGSTADSDPGAGLLKFNNATVASASFIYIDDATVDAQDLSTYFGNLGAAGFTRLVSVNDPGEWAVFKWSAVTDGTGYWKLAVVYQAGFGSFEDDDEVLVLFDSDGTGGSGSVTSVSASGGLQTTSGSPITGSGTIQAASVINAQTGTSYAVASTDRGKHVTLSNASSIAATIAQAGTTGFEDGYATYLECIGAGAVTLTPTTSAINGAATLVLTSGMSAVLFSDGTNYRAFVHERAGVSVNAQTGTSYTYLSGDRNKLVTHTNASAIAGTLPQATGAFGSGWFAWVQNRGAGTLTITPTTSTIDGASTLALTTGQGVLLASDGTNYFTLRGLSSGGGSLTNFTEAVNTLSPNATVPVVSLTATNAATDVDAAFKPKGAGAVTAHIADSTSTGGNKRGANASDWQTKRGNANQVASGAQSHIGGGENNRASAQYSAVLCGLGCSALGAYSSIGGGNGHTINHTYCFIGGGDSNTAAAAASYMGILCGDTNTVSADWAAILGGRLNQATALYAAVINGNTALATGQYSVAQGAVATADGTYSQAWGRRVHTKGRYGARAFGSGSVADSATRWNQMYEMVLRKRTSDATPTRLTSNDGAQSSTNSPSVELSSAMTFQGTVTAVLGSGTNNQSKGWKFEGVIYRTSSGNATLISAVTPVVIAETGSATSWSIAVTADTTNQVLAVEATGVAATTIEWTCHIHCVETISG